MSLSAQSQQWYPTSIQVTVHQARNLRFKGKNGTNDAYAIMQVSKDKFSTSVVEKCISPVWKEEASFDLPLFHQGNHERCTLYIIVMHRAQVGLDKHLGQAVVNLIDLHDDKERKKTDWYKLVDKTGKEDKARGEVLLDIQFMRNNMSASMFDLSMQDKPRSRISKLKDKVRGKKKEGFSDSASAVVPSSQVLTDSEGEGDAHFDSPGTKKKSKLKSLFAPKSNLQRNVSQSMSTLGTLPEKGSSLSGSRSSGLNSDSPDVKKKFKFLGHKRTGSNDSKASQGPFSLLGRSKQSANDPNSLCINGSHVYAEEAEPKSGSTPSLASSGQGSAEDVRRHNSDVSVDSFKGFSVPSYRPETADRDRALQEQRRHLEEEERRQAEEKCRAEAKRQQQQEEEERKLQEEQERRRRFLEDDARKKKLKEEEEERKRLEEERRRLEEERRRLQAEEECRSLEEEQKQQEARRAEEQKRQEEASMTDRLSTLFGMIRKKEEKKEEAQQQSSSSKDDTPQPAPAGSSRGSEGPGPRYSNPFEEIPLSPDPPSEERPGDQHKARRTPQVPSAMVFLNRTAKVSAVKPRLLESQTPETPDSHTQGPQSRPSSPSTQTSFSSVPESPDTFSNLHSSLAPPNIRRGSSECPGDSPENIATVGSSSTMAEKKRQAPLPPAYGTRPEKLSQMQPQGSGGLNTASRTAPVKLSASSSYLVPIREVENSGAGAKHGKRPALPPPDYESLFLHKRHGVQGQTRWDHIIAEVNQKQREGMPQLADDEMSVDSPEEYSHSDRSAPMRSNQQKTQPQDVQSTSKKKALAPPPPKAKAAASPRLEVDVHTATQHGHSAAQTNLSKERPNASASMALRPTKPVTPSIEVTPVKPRHDLRKVHNTSAIVNDAKSVTPGERPTPPSRVETVGERPTPPSRIETVGERPTPPSRVESVGERPTPPSRIESVAERPTPPSRVDSPEERPTPVSRVEYPEERPTPASQVVSPAERPTPVSRVESVAERPTPPSRVEYPEERPTPVSRVVSPIERPTPASQIVSPEERPTPVSRVVSLAERPTPVSRVESPEERPTPVSRVVSLAERPTPVSRVVSPAERPTPASQVEYPAERPTPASRVESPEERQTPVSRVESPEERPTPVSRVVSLTERPTPASQVESPAERPTPASRVESPAERPTPVSRVVSLTERPTPASQVESPAERPTPASQVESPEERPTPASQVVLDTTSADDQNVTLSNIPTVKPRHKIGSKESVTQVEPREQSLQSTVEKQENRPQLDQDSPVMRCSSPVTMRNTGVNVSRKKKPSPDSTDDTDKKHVLEKIMNAQEKLVEPNPFPSSEVLSKDPWAPSEHSQGGDDMFTGGIQKEHKFEDQGMTPDDLDKLFASGNSTDCFSNFNSNFSEEQPEQSKADMASNEQSPYFKRGLSQRKKRSSQSRTTSDKGAMRNGARDKLDSLGTETTMKTTSESLRLDRPEPQADSTRQSYGREKVEPRAREDQWSADPFTLPSSSPVPFVLTTPEPLQSGVGESTSQNGVPSGGKTLLKAWVSPSEVQLSNSGGGPASTPRRPHPVKPLSSTENQPPTSTPVAREIKALDSTAKMKVTGRVESGPYTQLTQEELISLVVKQQGELSKKDAKIVELEEYIDNLLVRVIEEKPSILLGLSTSKSAL